VWLTKTNGKTDRNFQLRLLVLLSQKVASGFGCDSGKRRDSNISG
jgi:hypothetical protein